jgi:hypothetical protein
VFVHSRQIIISPAGTIGHTSAVEMRSRLSIKLIPSTTHLKCLQVEVNPPSISGTAMPFSERHFRRFKTCFHFLATYVAPQHKITEPGKWIIWLVYAAFKKNRCIPTPFTGLRFRSDVSYSQTRITEMATNICHLAGVPHRSNLSYLYPSQVSRDGC